MAKYFLEVSYIVYMVAVFSRDGLEKPCREQIQLIVPQRGRFVTVYLSFSLTT